jgi:hypothetical protein
MRPRPLFVYSEAKFDIRLNVNDLISTVLRVSPQSNRSSLIATVERSR